MPEKETGTGAVYNSVIAVSPEGVDAVYRKIHPLATNRFGAKRTSAGYLADALGWHWAGNLLRHVSVSGAFALLCGARLPALLKLHGPGWADGHAAGQRANAAILPFDLGGGEPGQRDFSRQQQPGRRGAGHAVWRRKQSLARFPERRGWERTHIARFMPEDWGTRR